VMFKELIDKKCMSFRWTSRQVTVAVLPGTRHSDWSTWLCPCSMILFWWLFHSYALRCPDISS